MFTFGLIGHPLGHSFSQAYFTEKFERWKIHARYLNYDIADVSELRHIIAADSTIMGLNVTIPHKQAVIPLLDSVHPDASAIGAVNVIKVSHDADGKTILTGHNTDVIGFTASLRPLVAGRAGGIALVLGTGGASRAVAHGLKSLGLFPQPVSRRRADGVLCYADISAEVLRGTVAVINCTPLGTWPDTDACPPLPYDLLKPETVCFDLVYNPAVTRFMSECAARGCAVKNGLEMLHGQAEAAWQIWNEPD